MKLLYAIWSWHHWQAWECLHWCRYLENVPAIVPLLEKEYRNAAARLESTQDELNDLHPDKYAPPHLVLQHLLCSYWHDGPASDRLSHCRAQGSSAVHTMMHNSHRISQFAQKSRHPAGFATYGNLNALSQTTLSVCKLQIQNTVKGEPGISGQTTVGLTGCSTSSQRVAAGCMLSHVLHDC